MKINNFQIAGIQKAYSQKSRVEKTEGGNSCKREDGVNLSFEAHLLNAAKKALQEVPDHDHKKIDELKKQIREDSFKVSNEDLAEKIWQELLSKNY